MPVLALLTQSTAVANTDLEAVWPIISHGVPVCTGGFDIVIATTSASASPRGEVGDDGKEPGDLGVTRRKGGGEGQVGDDKPVDGVILLDNGVHEVVERKNHRVSHLHLCGLFHHAV